jgi:hypothetical protein
MTIVHNRIMCQSCGDVIESKHRHDFVWCKCQAVAVDGGRSYLRRVGTSWVEMSEFTKDEDK